MDTDRDVDIRGPSWWGTLCEADLTMGAVSTTPFCRHEIDKGQPIQGLGEAEITVKCECGGRSEPRGITGCVVLSAVLAVLIACLHGGCKPTERSVSLYIGPDGTTSAGENWPSAEKSVNKGLGDIMMHWGHLPVLIRWDGMARYGAVQSTIDDCMRAGFFDIHVGGLDDDLLAAGPEIRIWEFGEDAERPFLPEDLTNHIVITPQGYQWNRSELSTEQIVTRIAGLRKAQQTDDLLISCSSRSHAFQLIEVLRALRETGAEKVLVGQVPERSD